MDHDDAVWNVIGQSFCSYKVKLPGSSVRFCRHPLNVTGLCQRGVCPIANANYATIVEYEDELYLYIKTAERAHLPRRMWEKVKLESSFPKALAQIDENLQWWDRKLVNKVKARLLRMKQFLMRKRKLLLEPQPEIVSNNKRLEDKLVRREEKAEQAARIELEIEKELLERLKNGTYDSVINANREAFERLLDKEGVDEEMEVEESDEEEDLEDYTMDEEDESDFDIDDVVVTEGDGPSGGSGKKTRRRTKLIIEKEIESEPPTKKFHGDINDW